MKLKAIGLSLCLTAMAGILFNMGAAACTTPSASNQAAKGISTQQQSYQQSRFPQAVGTSTAPMQFPQSPFGNPFAKASSNQQKQQLKNTASSKTPAKSQPKNPFPGGKPTQKPTSSAPSSSNVQDQRKQIDALNAQVISLKTEARNDIGKICSVLAKVAFDKTLQQSQDYKTILDTLNKVKGELAAAEKINYRAKLVSVKGKNDSSTLDDVITQLNTKISALTAVVNELNNTLSTANALAQQAQDDRQSGSASSQPGSSGTSSQPSSSQSSQDAAKQAWQQFAAAADAKKQTIDGNAQKISSVTKNCQDVVNEIVATAAANKDILANQGSAMADIVAQLGTVEQSLATEYNGKITEALKAYNQDVAKKDYNDALGELDSIIDIQNSRIDVVQSALSDLQSALSSLQNLVATAAASDGSTSSSSAAA